MLEIISTFIAFQIKVAVKAFVLVLIGHVFMIDGGGVKFEIKPRPALVSTGVLGVQTT